MEIFKTKSGNKEIMEDLRQTEAWGQHLLDKGWRVVTIKAADGIHNMQAFIVPLGLFGFTMMKLQRSEYDPNWSDLAAIKRKNWVASSIIEPQKIQDVLGFKMAGYKLTRFPYLATKTYIVDLGVAEEKLWEGLSENAKRMIKKNEKIEVLEVSPKDFLSHWKRWSKIWTMKEREIESLKRHFGDKMRLVVCSDGNTYHSGLMLLSTKDCTNYYQTWTAEEGRKSGAHYKLVWEEILHAKRSGQRYFDLEGIFDERWPQKRWRGFTEFKRRFGGKEVSFPGSYFRWF